MSSMRRHRLTRSLLSASLALSACFQDAAPPPPPAPPPDPSVSAKELNALAAPVIPKAGSGIKLKSLQRPTDSDPQAQQAQQAPALQAKVAPQAEQPAQQPQAAPAGPASLAPVLPSARPASTLTSNNRPGAAPITQPAAKPAAQPATFVENLEALVKPLLPGKEKPKPKATIETRLDKRDIAALSADLPPPPPGTTGAKQVEPPADEPPAAAEPAPDPSNTFAAALPNRERATTSSAAGTPAAWLITAKGVGALRIGARLTGTIGDIGAHYTATVYGNRQTLEGFALEEPPVFVAVRKGPAARTGRAHPDEPVPDAVRQSAVELVQAGKLPISMLIVTHKGPRTDRGVGVGDSYASFAKAYPGAGTPASFPVLWEDPTCVITQKTLWFFFDRCDEQSKVTRIMVRGRR